MTNLLKKFVAFKQLVIISNSVAVTETSDIAPVSRKEFLDIQETMGYRFTRNRVFFFCLRLVVLFLLSIYICHMLLVQLLKRVVFRAVDWIVFSRL